MSIDTLKQLKVAKYKCNTDSLFYNRYFFKHQYGRKFVLAEYHRILAAALDKVYRGEITRLIINIAPRYTKTEMCVKGFISKGLALNPKSKYIHLSYSDDLALDNSEAIKDLVQSEAYQQLYPHVKVKKDSKAKEKWYTTEGGGVLARAAGGAVTGFGAGKVEEEDTDFELESLLNELDLLNQFGGAIVIDDPIKPEDADSDTIRERVNNRFDSTIRNRVNSRKTPIIITMQRTHPRDLTGYLLDVEPGVWTVISLPCINSGEYEQLPAGQPLWEFKHTLAELEKLREVNEVVFERQYMQNPKPKEGLLFPMDELRFYDPAKDYDGKAEFKYVFIDPAGGGDDDLSAPLFEFQGDKIFVTDVLYNKLNTDYNEPACIDMIVRNKVNAAGIEGVFAWEIFAKRIRSQVEEVHEDCEIRIHKPNTNKHVRILAQSSFIKNKMYFRSDYDKIPQYNRFMQNLTNYLRITPATKAAKHDDAPDSLAGGAKYFQTNFSHIF